MKTLLPCALLALLAHSPLAEQRTTPSPFPGWGPKTAAPGTTAGGSDKNVLLGQWDGFIADGDGSNPSQRRMNITLNIAAEKITSSGAGNIGEGTYRISAGSGNLKHID